MACFAVPAVEAIVVTASYFAVKKKEQKLELKKNTLGGVSVAEESSKIKLSRKISWLMTMLWGGVLLLAFEHFWHGEIVPFPPFLTAMATPDDKAEMLHEISTVGVSMAAFVTAAWGAICIVASALYKKATIRRVEEGNN
ncbi:MAG: hypothetical protein K2G60_01860 [Oscillospiraceae bacterium]|nr:hypothetical protein [Oscillospiraceae bacterium]